MLQVVDTFNRRSISRHRTAVAAVRAQRAFARAIKRANGRDSYIPTDILGAPSRKASCDSWYDVLRPLTDSEAREVYRALTSPAHGSE